MLQHARHVLLALLISYDDHLITPELKGRLIHTIIFALAFLVLPTQNQEQEILVILGQNHRFGALKI